MSYDLVQSFLFISLTKLRNKICKNYILTFLLCGCIDQFLILGEEYRLRASGTRVQTRMFRPGGGGEEQDAML
jgi:hypothetical protein